MMQVFRSPVMLGLVLISFTLVGCSRSEFRDRSSDYDQAQAAAFDLPPEFAERPQMRIPQVDQTPVASKRVPRPEPLTLLDEAGRVVELRQEDERSWLLVLHSPSAVWPALQGYLDQAGLSRTQADPRRGQLAWSGEQGTQSLVLRQGVRRGTSEVRLFSLDDQGQRVFTALDQQTTEQMEVYLRDVLQQENRQVSLEARSLHAREQVERVEVDGESRLYLTLDYDRAWNELAQLLEDQFDQPWQKLNDLDRSAGHFYLRYVPQDQRPSGFFSRWWSRGTGQNTHQYRLVLQPETASRLQLSLETAEGEAAPEAVQQEVMRWLERQLR